MERIIMHVERFPCGTGRETEAIIGLFEEIAAAEGWQPGTSLRESVSESVYFGLWSDDGGGKRGLAGGLQLLRPDNAGGLPCSKVWPELSFGSPNQERGALAYIAMLAVRKEWRGKRGDVGAACFWMLTGALWRYCMENGITDLWLEATPTMLRCYRLLGWPLQVRGPLRSHWGEDCYPCSLSLRETAGALVEKALRSRTYRRIIENALGIGTDQRSGATSPTA